MEENQTGVFTGTTPPVNPAPATPPPSSLPTFDAATAQRYEDRIRALMSEKDRTRAEYEKAVAERLAVQQRFDELAANHQSITNGAARQVDEALNRANEFETKLARAEAERLKLEQLSDTPELLKYREMIPAFTDSAAMQTAIAKFKEARERDIAEELAKLQAAQQQQSQNTPTQNPEPTSPEPDPARAFSAFANLYPKNTFTPPANPARPASGATTSSTIESIQDQLQAATREAYDTGNWGKVDQILEEQAKVAANIDRASLSR